MTRPTAAIQTTRAKRVRILVLVSALVVLAGAVAWADSELDRAVRTPAPSMAAESAAAAGPQAPAPATAHKRQAHDLALHDAPAPSSFTLLALGAVLFAVTYARQRRRVQAA